MRAVWERDAAALSRLMVLAVVGWLAYVGLLMVVLKGQLSADLLLVIAALVVIALLAHRPWFREVLPLPLIGIAWEAMRGLGPSLVARVHAADIADVERTLFGPLAGGRTPTEALQAALHVTGSISPLDVVMTVVYLGHFAAPVIIGIVLWRRSRAVYYRFSIAMIVVALAGYGTQLLVPVAPPRLAAQFGAAVSVEDITGQVLAAFHAFPIASWGYGNLSGNELAALPSLHAAFPLVGAFFLARVSVRATAIALVWSALVWFAIVYLGQHYLVDALLGTVYVAVLCPLVSHPAFDRLTERLASMPMPARLPGA